MNGKANIGHGIPIEYRLIGRFSHKALRNNRREWSALPIIFLYDLLTTWMRKPYLPQAKEPDLLIFFLGSRSLHHFHDEADPTEAWSVVSTTFMLRRSQLRRDPGTNEYSLLLF